VKHFPHYEGWQQEVSNFFDAVGMPDPAAAAIGYVAIKFSWLEDAISEGTAKLLATDANASAIVAAEASFRAKVNMLGALVSLRVAEGSFHNGWPQPQEAMSELASLLLSG
jgi:hypothetical protein